MPQDNPKKRKVVVKRKESTPSKPKLSKDDQIVATNNKYLDVFNSPYFVDTLGVKARVGPGFLGEGGPYGYYNPETHFIGVNLEKPVEDEASGGPMAGDNTARQVLTHEGGHSLDSKERFPSYYAVNRPTFSVPFGERKAMAISEAMMSDNLRRTMPATKKGYGAEDTFDMIKGESLQPNKLLGVLPYGEKMKPMPPSEIAAIKALDPYYSIGGLYRKGFSDVAATNPDESFAQAFVNASDYLSKTAADTTGYREKIGQYEGNTPGSGAIVRDLLMGNKAYANHPLKKLIR